MGCRTQGRWILGLENALYPGWPMGEGEPTYNGSDNDTKVNVTSSNLGHLYYTVCEYTAINTPQDSATILPLLLNSTTGLERRTINRFPNTKKTTAMAQTWRGPLTSPQDYNSSNPKPLEKLTLLPWELNHCKGILLPNQTQRSSFSPASCASPIALFLAKNWDKYHAPRFQHSTGKLFFNENTQLLSHQRYERIIERTTAV